MSTLDIIKRIISEAEGGGTSVDSKKSIDNQKKRAQIMLKSADLRLKQQKEREALARQSAAVKEETESLEELSSKKLSDYSDKASDDVHRLDKEGNTKKANKRFDGVVRASDKMTDAGKKLRGTSIKEEELDNIDCDCEECRADMSEDLRNWFNKNHPDGDWKRVNTKGEVVGPCAREPGEPKPKCMSKAKRAALSKKEKANAVRTKRKHDSDPDRKGAPINVSSYGKGKISEDMKTEKKTPSHNAGVADDIKRITKDALARKKANESVSPKLNNEDTVDEACWDTHKQVGMKKKGNRMVPDCVPKNEGVDPAHKKVLDKEKTSVPKSPKDEYDRKVVTYLKKKYAKEEVEQIDEKNVPTSPDKWARAIAMAKSKFDVYPSAYANGWAAKKYKEMGGGWKSVKEETISESGGDKVFKNDDGHIEKYGENSFAVYLDGKKQKSYGSLEAAKKALASGKEKDEDDEDDSEGMDEGLKPDHLKPGWMLRKDPELAKKLKDKQDLAKKRQQSYGDPKAGVSVKEEAELDESSKYQIYHPSYTSAVQHAVSQVEKQGFKIDMDDYERKVAFGPRKPSAGKTNSFSITLMDKNGKISKKQLQMQVYGMEGGKYELNMYTEDLDESQMHTAPETVKHYTADQKTKSGVAKWVAQTIDKKKKEMKEAEEFKQGGKPLEKKFNKAFKSMGVDAKVKVKTTNNVSINEEDKPKKSYKNMKKKLENTSDKDIKAGEKLSGKQEPIDLKPTIDNNR